MKKICLISPFPPAQNPRLLKEYQTLKSTGYDVIVVYAERDVWATHLPSNNRGDFKRAGGAIGSFFYNLTRISYKLIFQKTKEYSANRVSFWLERKVLGIKADLYIAHNLGALPVAVKAAQKHHAKCGFDAEDFHRQETTDDKNSQAYKISKYLEDKYLPSLNYFSAASPLIAEEYRKLYPFLVPVVLNNVFPKLFQSDFKEKTEAQGLKLFWFSQTVGPGRGLENILKAMGKIENPAISLTLLGNISDENKKYFVDLSRQNGLIPTQLMFQGTMRPDDIFAFASDFDIGLALEETVPYNRNICLTNKIFTYAVAGLAILASATDAQKRFLEENGGIGQVFTSGNTIELAALLSFYATNRKELSQAKKNAWSAAREKLNWEYESLKFKSLISGLLENV